MNPHASADFRFGAHYGLMSDIARGPKCANSGLREVRARSRKALPSRRVADVREAA
jgi:hypothetical protein